jgi:hypothetical protein
MSEKGKAVGVYPSEFTGLRNRIGPLRVAQQKTRVAAPEVI